MVFNPGGSVSEVFNEWNWAEKIDAGGEKISILDKTVFMYRWFAKSYRNGIHYYRNLHVDELPAEREKRSFYCLRIHYLV